MLTLYTAVGTLKFQKTTGGKSIPLVINDGQEYGLSDDELLLWSCLAFQILTLHELQDAYTLRQIQKEGPKGLSFQHYLNRLSLRGLVVSGIGLTGVDALYLISPSRQSDHYSLEGYLSHPALWLRSALSGRNYWCKRVWQIFKEETLFTDGRYHSEAG